MMNDNLVDDIVKLLVAGAITGTFVYTVVTGDNVIPAGGSEADKFQLLSVIGPLFGMVLGYYFMKDKKK